MLPECGGSLSYLGEDTAEQLELMRAPSGLSGRYGKNMPVLSAMHRAGTCTFAAHRAGCRRTGALARVLTSKYAEHTPLYRQSEYTAGKVWS